MMNTEKPEEHESQDKKDVETQEKSSKQESPPAEPPKTPDDDKKETSPLVMAKNLITELNEKSKSMKEQADRLESLIQQANKVTAEMQLEGRAFAGQEQTEEQKAIKAAQSLLEGTGLNPFDDAPAH